MANKQSGVEPAVLNKTENMDDDTKSKRSYEQKEQRESMSSSDQRESANKSLLEQLLRSYSSTKLSEQKETSSGSKEKRMENKSSSDRKQNDNKNSNKSMLEQLQERYNNEILLEQKETSTKEKRTENKSSSDQKERTGNHGKDINNKNMLNQPGKTVPKPKERSTASTESPNMMEAMNTLMKQQMQMQKLMVQMIAKNREQEKKLEQTEKALRSKQDQLEHELRVRREQDKKHENELEEERKAKIEERQQEHDLLQVGTPGNTENVVEQETVVCEQNKEGEMEASKRVYVDHIGDQLRCSKEEHDKIGLKRSGNEEIGVFPLKLSRLEDNEGVDGETVDNDGALEIQIGPEQLDSMEMNEEHDVSDQEQFVEKVMEFWGQPVQLDPVDPESEQNKEVKQVLEDLESDIDIIEVKQERQEPILVIDLESEDTLSVQEEAAKLESRQQQEERRQKLRSALLKKQQAIHDAHIKNEQEKVRDGKKIEEYQQLRRAEWQAKVEQDSVGEEPKQETERLRPRTQVLSYSEEFSGSDNESFDGEYSQIPSMEPGPSHQESEHSPSDISSYPSGYQPSDRPYCPRGYVHFL